MRDFTRLMVFKKAHALTLAVYKATDAFPRTETFGLTSQTRRAAASIGANIFEGSGRSTEAEFSRFLVIALGPASELEYHIILARDLRLLAVKPCEQILYGVNEVKRMLHAFIAALDPKKRHRD